MKHEMTPDEDHEVATIELGKSMPLVAQFLRMFGHASSKVELVYRILLQSSNRLISLCTIIIIAYGSLVSILCTNGSTTDNIECEVEDVVATRTQ